MTTLSPQQAAFIDWIKTGHGSAILVARAGTGKTFTILQAVQALNVPCAILAYNKKIADEIKGKLQKLGFDYRRAQAATVHSFGLSAYKKSFPQAQVNDYKVPDLLKAMLDREVIPSTLKDFSEIILALVSMAKQRAIGVLAPIKSREAWLDIVDHFDLLDLDDTDTAEDHLDEIVSAAIKLLEASNSLTDVIDFNDMVYLPLVKKCRFWRFPVVFVDEAQDTNPARRALVRALVEKGGRVVAVGDPFQAIYGFTGADADSLDLIAKDFDAQRFPLSVTYRCPKNVVKFANRWVKDIEAHESAADGEVSSTSFADFVKRNDIRNGDTAILCRVTKPLVQVAFKMIRENMIPCKIEGRDVGVGLKKLATRWKKVKTLNALEDQLDTYLEKMKTKYLAQRKEQAAQNVEDQVETLKVIMDRARSESKHTVKDVCDLIDSLFSDNVSGILTLSTIHKSKGREFKRVFWLDRHGTCPSKYARQEWSKEQERNLMYVAATRAMESLFDLELPPEMTK
jgi:DNA helicase-2/ATP-dependent DNA helicase PcrA